MDSILRQLQGLKNKFAALSTPHKILSVGGVSTLLLSLAFLVYMINKPEYATLFSGLSQGDMGEAAQALKKKKIVYRLSNGVIEVPKEQVYEARLGLAAEGIPKGSGVGFEIFDQQKLGSTEFVQKINYQRAIQGELARTINEMDEVQECRVHIVMPEDSLFQEDRKPASAAVVLKLRQGAKLDQRRIQGIVHLAVCTVRGLEEDRVTILSTDGQVLFRKNVADQQNQMSNLQLEHKRATEEELNQKVQSMLQPLLGTNRVLTRVAVDLDLNRMQMSEDTYDPDSAVIRSQQRSIENSDGKEMGAKGNPDVPINVESKLLQNAPEGETASTKSKQHFNRQREVVNYEINHVNRQTVHMPGAIKKLSLAVIVDGNYETKPDANGKPQLTFVGRSAQEMKSIEDVVKKAVGFTEGRGDQISVSNIPFASNSAGEGGTGLLKESVHVLKNNYRIILNLLLTALVFFFVVRPFMRKMQKTDFGDAMRNLPAPVPSLPGGKRSARKAGEAALPGEHEPEKLPLRKEVAGLVMENPERATEIIRGWLREEG